MMGNTNIICTMVKYGETFDGRHTALYTTPAGDRKFGAKMFAVTIYECCVLL